MDIFGIFKFLLWDYGAAACMQAGACSCVHGTLAIDAACALLDTCYWMCAAAACNRS